MKYLVYISTILLAACNYKQCLIRPPVRNVGNYNLPPPNVF